MKIVQEQALRSDQQEFQEDATEGNVENCFPLHFLNTESDLVDREVNYSHC